MIPRHCLYFYDKHILKLLKPCSLDFVIKEISGFREIGCTLKLQTNSITHLRRGKYSRSEFLKQYGISAYVSMWHKVALLRILK